jgi:hypothetical protein
VSASFQLRPERFPENGPERNRFLRFARRFSNGACGLISVDLRHFQKNGLVQFAPLITGQEPAPVDEVEVWTREEVLAEIITQTGKVATFIGASGVEWELRAGQPPVLTGRRFPPGFSSIPLPELEADVRRKLAHLREENERLRAKLDEKRRAG